MQSSLGARLLVEMNKLKIIGRKKSLYPINLLFLNLLWIIKLFCTLFCSTYVFRFKFQVRKKGDIHENTFTYINIILCLSFILKRPFVF